jgi:outer membrane protein assembly factor BamD
MNYEYELTRRIRKIASETKVPTVGFVIGDGSFFDTIITEAAKQGGPEGQDPAEAVKTQLAGQLKSQLFDDLFSIEWVTLDKPVADTIDGLVLLGPTKDLGAEGAKNLDAFVMKGKGVAIFQSPYRSNSPDIGVIPGMPKFTVPEENKTGLEGIIESYGVTLNKDWDIKRIPYQKTGRKLPVVLSTEEVARLFQVVTNLKHRAILMTAYANYQAGNYIEAIGDADRFLSLYPGNPSAGYAHYLKAVCYFDQIVDVGRDQASTGQALAALRDVVQRYPQTEYAADARLKVDMVNDQLAGKEMSVGRYYLRNGDTLAAIGRFQTVLQRYQTTTHAPEALYRLVEANLTLGLAEEAKRNGAVLGYNYPGDYWYTEAYSLLTSKNLKPAVVPDAKAKRGLQLPFSKDPAKTVPPAVAEAPRPPGAG